MKIIKISYENVCFVISGFALFSQKNFNLCFLLHIIPIIESQVVLLNIFGPWTHLALWFKYLLARLFIFILPNLRLLSAYKYFKSLKLLYIKNRNSAATEEGFLLRIWAYNRLALYQDMNHFVIAVKPVYFNENLKWPQIQFRSQLSFQFFALLSRCIHH